VTNVSPLPVGASYRELDETEEDELPEDELETTWFTELDEAPEDEVEEETPFSEYTRLIVPPGVLACCWMRSPGPVRRTFRLPALSCRISHSSCWSSRS
jgi:hypothetical protein